MLPDLYLLFSPLFLGFRMAAECARNALLEKVVDNKADSGIVVSPPFWIRIFQGCIIVL